MPKKRAPSPVGSILLMAAGALLVIGAIVWYLVVIGGQTGTGSSSTTQSTPGFEDNFPQIERVSLQDAKTAYDQNGAVFIDVRSSEEYIQGHIPGSINIPLLDLPGRVDELSPDDWIITY